MKKAKPLLKAMILGYIVFFMIFEHAQIATEIREALKLWAGVLIPSLFPYLVLAQYITSSDILKIFYPLKKIVHRIFNVSESGANIYLCSFVSGYPSGAICASQLYQNQIIKKDEAERLVCFTNNAGPLFVISVVGTNMLSSTGVGVVLYVIQCICAMATGIHLGRKSEKIPYKSRFFSSKGMSIDKCTQNAINTMLMIGAFLMIASVICQLAVSTFEMIPVYGKQLSPYAKAFVYSLLEISNATKFLSGFGNTRLSFAFISGVLSWSGMCVIMQIKKVLPEDFAVLKIIRCKMWQSVISFCLAYGYKSFFVFNIKFHLDKMFSASVFASIIIFILLSVKKKPHGSI